MDRTDINKEETKVENIIYRESVVVTDTEAVCQQLAGRFVRVEAYFCPGDGASHSPCVASHLIRPQC